MRTLNLGILAHVDAGKTSLTERLLFAAGVIAAVGRVDDGDTQTDTLALERQRGITIKSAVVSFLIDDVTVNLIDTPGHPDFIAEVERALSVLDGAVLVISAVEGVQAQTRVLMRTLRRLGIPTMIFVNKIDRAGADLAGTLRAIAERLTRAVVPMGSVVRAGTLGADFSPAAFSAPGIRDGVVEVLADHDEVLLADYVQNESAISNRRLREVLAALTRRAVLHPVFAGSAVTGAGVGAVMAGIREFLPSHPEDGAGPVSGTVFKVERGSTGDKIAYVRMFSGTVRVRDRVRIGGGEGKITAIARVIFAPPTLAAVVLARPGDRGALRAALAQLAEQDPLINMRWDDVRHEISVSLYGEVQKEVIQSTLASEFGIDVTFQPSTTICIERPVAAGEAVERLQDESNPFRATIGLRIEPAPHCSGVAFELRVEPRTVPAHIYKNVAGFAETMGSTCAKPCGKACSAGR